MANGISTSREELIRYFKQMAQHIHETYGAAVWFAEIMGRRWSCLAGWKGKDISPFTPWRIELTDRFGVVVDGWRKIPADESKAIISSLREAIRAYE